MRTEMITEIGIRGMGEVVVGTPLEYADARRIAGSEDSDVLVGSMSAGSKATHLKAVSNGIGVPADIIVRHFPDRTLVTTGIGTSNTESSAGEVIHIVSMSKARILGDGGALDIPVGGMTINVKRRLPKLNS